MYSIFFVIATCCILSIDSAKFQMFVDPLTLISEKGYKGEKYTVQTEDGYLIKLYRIPHGLHSSKPNTRPILLNHGLSASAGDFLTLNPKRSLGYILAENGYDVWLVTARGATFSNRHISIPESDKRRFYNFTWHEIGIYDNPACIDFILKKTGQKQMQYLGHSQGGTAFLVMAAFRPEYNSKISLASLIGTTSIMDHVNPVMRLNVLIAGFIYRLPDMLYLYDAPLVDFFRGLLNMICQNDRYVDGCIGVFDAVGGYPHHAQLDLEVIHNIFRTLPSNFAVRQLLHYLQCIESGRFRPYDYGPESNLIRYGSEVPPDYNMTAVTTPISIFFGKNDHLARVEDSDYLLDRLPNLINYKIVQDDCWNHGDFLFGIDAMKLVYTDMLRIMSKY